MTEEEVRRSFEEIQGWIYNEVPSGNLEHDKVIKEMLARFDQAVTNVCYKEIE